MSVVEILPFDQVEKALRLKHIKLCQTLKSLKKARAYRSKYNQYQIKIIRQLQAFGLFYKIIPYFQMKLFQHHLYRKTTPPIMKTILLKQPNF